MNPTDFYEKQKTHLENAQAINEVKSEYDAFLKEYLRKDFKEWVDESILAFIEAKWDKEKVIKYINYIIDSNPEKLSTDDLSQLAALKNTLIRREINGIKLDYEKNILDFEIVWWTIEIKTINLKGKVKDINYPIIDSRVISRWNNRYNIKLKRENSNREYNFDIKYNWWNSITIYDQYWRYIWTQIIEAKEKTIIRQGRGYTEVYKTPWIVRIETNDTKIKLDIMFKR